MKKKQLSRFISSIFLILVEIIMFAAMTTKASLNTSFERSNIVYYLLLHQIKTHRNQCHAEQQINRTYYELDINASGTVCSFF